MIGIERKGTSREFKYQYNWSKKSLISRLNLVEGEIRGIKGLIEKDTYCDDVINQISSVQSALNSVARLLLERHLKGCAAERLAGGDFEVIGDLLATLQKLMRK